MAKHTPALKLKRAYEPAARSDGARILVERLWPRGVTRDSLAVQSWLKDVAPSTQLRKWFGHDPAKWTDFRRRYFRELDSKPEAWQRILEAARRGPVTLVYSSRDEQHNNAVALKEYFGARLRRGASRSRRG